MLVFADELRPCAESDRAIHNQEVCSKSGGGFFGISTCHKDKNRSPSVLYFRFHCIIIIGYDETCGFDT